MKGLKTGKLRLAVVTTAKYFAPRLLGMCCQKYPDVEVSPLVSNRERLLARLAANPDDLYILGQPSKAFLENTWVVIVPTHHPLAEIANEAFLLREPGSGTRQFAILDVQGIPIRRHWYFVYPAGKQLSIVASTFADFSDRRPTIRGGTPSQQGMR